MKKYLTRVIHIKELSDTLNEHAANGYTLACPPVPVRQELFYSNVTPITSQTHVLVNLGAYTPPGANYPPYISINTTRTGTVQVTVRGPVTEGREGPCASIEMTVLEFHNLLRDAQDRMRQL